MPRRIRRIKAKKLQCGHIFTANNPEEIAGRVVLWARPQGPLIHVMTAFMDMDGPSDECTWPVPRTMEFEVEVLDLQPDEEGYDD